jgi:predicted membrane channel-forming protein YqfA (hemolysin III family)
MNLSGPKRLWWWLALIIWVGVILGIVGILAQLVPIPALSGYVFLLLGIGWLILAVVAGVVFLKYVK